MSLQLEVKVVRSRVTIDNFFNPLKYGQKRNLCRWLLCKFLGLTTECY
jgi:hypothetical protein